MWRSYDEPGGYRDQMYALARDFPQVTKLVKIGTTLQGREILALKVTQGARDKPDGSRPAVLFSATQHAREWIATEIDRRLMYHYVNGWKNNDKQIKDLLKGTELWFVPVMNPDGYQYTFDVERLWRKNLRDNDGDGQTTIADGVDPNRNYPEHFKYDEEGSSKILSSQTYRGPGPASERETQAIRACRTGSASSSTSTTTPTAAGCCTRRAGRSAPRRPTTRSTSRCRATSTGRRSRASTRA